MSKSDDYYSGVEDGLRTAAQICEDEINSLWAERNAESYPQYAHARDAVRKCVDLILQRMEGEDNIGWGDKILEDTLASPTMHSRTRAVLVELIEEVARLRRKIVGRSTTRPAPQEDGPRQLDLE